MIAREKMRSRGSIWSLLTRFNLISIMSFFWQIMSKHRRTIYFLYFFFPFCSPKSLNHCLHVFCHFLYAFSTIIVILVICENNQFLFFIKMIETKIFSLKSTTHNYSLLKNYVVLNSVYKSKKPLFFIFWTIFSSKTD